MDETKLRAESGGGASSLGRVEAPGALAANGAVPSPAQRPGGALPAAAGLQGAIGRLLHRRAWRVLRLVVDLVLLYAGMVAAVLGAPAAGIEPRGVTIWVLPPLVVGILALRGSYRIRLTVRILDSVAELMGAVALTAMSLIAIDRLLDPANPGAGLLVRAWVFGTAYVAGGRVLLGLFRRSAQANGLGGQPTLIVGAGKVGAQVERRLRTHPELGLLPVGYLDADPVSNELAPGRTAPVLGPPSELARAAQETGAGHVIIAFLQAPDEVLVPLVRTCEERGLQMSLVPRLFDSITARVELEHIGGLPLYGLRRVDPRGWEFAVKHGLGKLIAGALLLLLAPLTGAVALAVRLTSPGPVVLRQRRIGRDGHEFEFLKFRSLRVDARPEGASRQAPERDPQPERFAGGDLRPGWAELGQRLTPMGGFLRRTSLDELPQLWNVIRGDMTLVGPRPEEPRFVELFGQSIRRYDDRHRVKSGVTGWAQVHGLRGKTSLADRIEWDNYYIQNWSLWLDFKILLMTLLTPFHRAD